MGTGSCRASTVIIIRRLGNSNLGDTGEMEEGSGMQRGKMLR